MRVELLSVTPHAKELIYSAARQCYSAEFSGDIWNGGSPTDARGNKVTDKDINKLVDYLFESGHTSVFEHVKFTFAIEGVSRALTHQLVRHRIASYSQQSQRYVSNESVFDINNFVVPPTIYRNEEAFSMYVEVLELIQQTYNTLQGLGVPAEDARYILPNASTTKIVVTMNCVALTHFLSLRLCSLAQWEIRNLSKAIHDICKDKLPEVFNRVGSRCEMLGYCPESEKRCCGKYMTKNKVLKNDHI